MRFLVVLAWACNGCSACPGRDLVVEGDTPYTRCLAMPAPESGAFRVGELTIEVDGRHVRVHGPGAPWTVAAFSGPAPGRLNDAVRPLREQPPQAALLLGGVGDDASAVRDTLAQLSALPFPTFVLPGGRDDHRQLAAFHRQLSMPQRKRVVLLSGVRSLRLGEHEFVVLPGAEDGRYGRDRNTCGFSEDDLPGVADDLPELEPGVSRWLLSWTAPGGGGELAVARTHLGLDVGSAAVAAFAARAGAPGGLFAWPTVRAFEASGADGAQAPVPGDPSSDLRLVVPRLGGPRLVRSDGSPVPSGVARISLQRNGMRLLDEEG